MLKELLKEIHTLTTHLNDTGYFAATAPKVISVNRPTRGPARYASLRGKKLTRAEAIEIYHEDRYSFPEIAEIYGVHTSTVYDIKFGRCWSKATGHKLTDDARLRVAKIPHGKKLTPKDVLEIYNDQTMSPIELGVIYGVSSNSINNIKAGRAWAAVTGHKK